MCLRSKILRAKNEFNHFGCRPCRDATARAKRLIEVADATGTVAEYAYDALGRRVTKHVADSATTTRYVYSGSQVVEEYENGSSTPARRFVLGPGLDQPILMHKLTGTDPGCYYYLRNRQGSIIALADSGGAVKESYTYSAYGTPSLFDNTGTEIPPASGLRAPCSALSNPYGYTGRRWDAESALWYYRHRMYSPALGRFLTRDPVGYVDGLNLYQYVRGNPLAYIDPWGLAAGTPIRPGDNYSTLDLLGASLLGWYEGLGQGTVTLGKGLVRATVGNAVDAGQSIGVAVRLYDADEFVPQGSFSDYYQKAFDPNVAAYNKIPVLSGVAERGADNLSYAFDHPDDPGAYIRLVQSGAEWAGTALGGVQVYRLVGGPGAYEPGATGATQSQPAPKRITDPGRLLPEPSGTNPHLEGGPMYGVELPEGFRFNQAVGSGQKSPGAFGTPQEIPSIDFVRNDLAVIPEFKPQVSGVRTVEVVRPVRAQISVVGPQSSAGSTASGRAVQFQILDYDPANPFVKFVGPESPLK